MKPNLRSLFNLLVLASGSGLVAPALSAQTAAEGSYYFYNGQRVALQPSTTEVMVKTTAAASATSAQAMSTTLALPANSVSSVSSVLIPGWSKVTLRAPAAAAAATTATAASATAQTQAQTRTMSAQPGVTFVSPLFSTASGSTLAPTTQIMVGYRPGINAAQTFIALRTANTALVSQAEIGRGSGIWLLQTNLRDGFAVLALANTLQAHASIAFATPDFVQQGKTNAIPTDPKFSDTWGLRNTGQRYSNASVTYNGLSGFDLGATQAWDITMGASTILVLVMDDGVQLNHPDIPVAAGSDFTGTGGSGGPVSSNDRHGTSVAGCIAGRANNGVGSTGIAPNVRIAAAKIYTPDANGSFFRQDSWVVSALTWGRSIGARVSNSSWGGGGGSSAIDSAFQSTKAAGMVHFASAGNSNVGTIGYPSSCPYVNSVGAAGPDGRRINIAGWWGSNYGTGLKFMAPGIFMWSTDRTGSLGYDTSDYCQFSGTSAASPYAAGVAALVLSREPTLTADQVTTRMSQTCTDMGVTGYDTETGYGMLNAYRALGGSTGTGDDHGNTTGTATTVSIPSTVNGVLETAADRDMFRFVLTSTTNVTLKSDSSFDTYGYLFNSAGSEITRDDDSNGALQFRIQATLSAGTYYVAVESYNNNYSGSYRLILEGASAGAPLMSITGNSTVIPDGDTTPVTTDNTLFGSVAIRNTNLSKTFTVRNTGTVALTLNGSPLVSLSGAGAAQFSVYSQPASSVSSGGSTSFILTYQPIAAGTHDAVVSIASNDATTSPYTFTVRGTATFPIDDHGNTTATATSVSRPSNTLGVLHDGADVDMFKFTLTASSRVVIRTTGSTDTLGYLLNSSGTILLVADDTDTDLNFMMGAKLAAGTYYVRVQGYDSSVTGAYTLQIQ